MKNVIKWVAIGIGGLFALTLVLGTVLAIAGVGQDSEKPSAVSTIKETPAVATNSAKPVERHTEAVKPTVKPKPVPSKPVPTKVTQKPMTNTEAFLYVLRKEYPQLKNADDSVLLNAGHSVCSSFRAGYSLVDIGYVLIDSGMTAEQAGYVIGASTAAFCPKYNVGGEE